MDLLLVFTEVLFKRAVLPNLTLLQDYKNV